MYYKCGIVVLAELNKTGQVIDVKDTSKILYGKLLQLVEVVGRKPLSFNSSQSC